jgi:hypothetical protein
MSDVAAEIDALWFAVFGEPPCIRASPDMVLNVLMRCMPVAPTPAEAWVSFLLLIAFPAGEGEADKE